MVDEEYKVTYDEKAWQNQASSYAKELYDSPESRDYLKLLDWVAYCYEPGKKVLEVGCAGGHNYKRLLERKHVNIDDYTGIDITKAYIDLAREKFPKGRWDHGDARNLPYKDEEFDLTFCTQVLLHMDKEGATKALSEMARVTKDMIFIMTPTAAKRYNGVVISSLKNSRFLYNILGMNELNIPGWMPFHMEPVFKMPHYGPLCCFPDDLEIYGEFIIINEKLLRPDKKT